VRGTVHTLVACRCAAGGYPRAAAVNDRRSGHEQPLGEEPPPIRTPPSSQTSVKMGKTPGPPERVAADIMRHLIGNTATTDDIALVGDGPVPIQLSAWFALHQ